MNQPLRFVRVILPLGSLMGLFSGCDVHTERHHSPDVLERSELKDISQEVEGATHLVHAARWEALEVSDDPVAAANLSAETQCSTSALTVELTDDGLYLDLDTSECSWLTVTQTSLVPLQKGDTLRVWAFRWPMVVAEGEALLSLSAGNPPLTLWEARPLLPQERSELYYDDVYIQSAIPSGTPLYWHVANHGQNVWSLVGLLKVHSGF